MKKRTSIFIFISILLLSQFGNSTSITSISALDYETNEKDITIDSEDDFWEIGTMELVSTESTAFYSNYPSVTTDSNNNIHVFWQDETDYLGSGTDMDLFYKKYDRSSKTWSATEVITTESTDDSIYSCAIVDSDNNIHLVWQDLTPLLSSGTDTDVFYKKWDSSTQTWSSPELVSSESTSAVYRPLIVSDSNNNLHVVWRDETDYLGAGTDRDIFYKRWESSTESWTAAEIVTTESTLNNDYPSLTIDSYDNLHLVFEDLTDYLGAGADEDIFYKKWDSTTKSWLVAEIVSSESSSTSMNPTITTGSSGDIHIAWQDATDYLGSGTDMDVFYKKWDNFTQAWTVSEVITTGSTELSGSPSIVTDSVENLHLVYLDEANYLGAGTDRDVFYQRWEKSTETWGSIELVSKDSNEIIVGSWLAIDSKDNLHIVWSDETECLGSGTDRDVFYCNIRLLVPSSPQLSTILPNPSLSGNIFLDWEDIPLCVNYHIFRSDSYIWSVENLTPIASTQYSNYSEIIDISGIYFYAVVAENLAGNGSISNCQYVELNLQTIAPELAIITPNPTDVSNIFLDWNDIPNAIEYFVYRSDSYIWSIDTLTPIALVVSSSYIDSLPSQGYYFYVIVASDGSTNSTISNCLYVEYKLPTLIEYLLPFGLVACIGIFALVITAFRRRNTHT